MIQGDAYEIALNVKNRGQPLDIATVERLEVTLLDLRRTYPETVRYEGGRFLLPLTQEDTLHLPPLCPMQIRVKLTGGSVVGSQVKLVRVGAAISGEVL